MFRAVWHFSFGEQRRKWMVLLAAFAISQVASVIIFRDEPSYALVPTQIAIALTVVAAGGFLTKHMRAAALSAEPSTPASRPRTAADRMIVLALHGNYTLNAMKPTILDEVRQLAQQGYATILLDLRDVGIIDSSGIGDLVAAYTMATNLGATLKILNIPASLEELLQHTQLSVALRDLQMQSDVVPVRDTN